MKCLMLVVAFTAVALARPDVSHLNLGDGYSYNRPHTSYGVPIQSGESQQHHHHEVPTGSYLPSSQHLPRTDSHVDFVNSRYQQSGSSYREEAGYNPSLIQDQKHVYYFASPDEQEEQNRLRINIVPSNQKNTNVIFVKAPSYSAPIPEVHAPAAQIEDKTKVVVLVKKPEKQAAINIPAPAPAKHDKPEVFVVKYKDQHEAERVVAGGSGGHPLGSNVHQVRDKYNFVKALEGDQVPHNDRYSGVSADINVLGSRSGIDSDGSVGGSGSLVKSVEYHTVRDGKDSLGDSSFDGSSFGGSSSGSFGGSSSGVVKSVEYHTVRDGKDSLGDSSFDGSSFGGSSSGGVVKSVEYHTGRDDKDSFGGSSSSFDGSFGVNGNKDDKDASFGSSSSHFESSDIRTGGGKIDSFGGFDSAKDGSHSSGSVSSFEVSGSGSDGDFASSSLNSRIGGDVRDSKKIKITVETDGLGSDSFSSGSSRSSSHTLEDDSLFSKYGPPKESGPY